jgi:hypothetical protein
MLNSSARAFTSLALISGVFLTLGTTGCSSDASTPEESASTATDEQQLRIGNGPAAVTKTKDGWIHFHNTAISKVDLIDPLTRTIDGTRDADGTCEVASAGEVLETADAEIEEDIAFNPTTCQRVTVRGKITEASLAVLDKMAADADPQMADHEVAVDATQAGPEAGADSALGAAAVRYTHSAYVKTAWIDPVDITITSLADNLDWNAARDLRAIVQAYKFKYDGWSMTPSRPPIAFHWGSNWGEAATHEQFRNTDFEKIIIAVFGLAGYVMCGFNSDAAIFTHNLQNYGYTNGARAWRWKDNAHGGCVNLVHHRAWHGPGHRR